MKKFSTIALILSFASALTAMTPADAQAAAAIRCEFLPDAPDQHLVAQGDTLWGISRKFLKSPWCWPQVWGANREQIRDPHWIFPGQTVYFDRVAGRLRLGKPVNAEGSARQDIRLSPQIRMETLESHALSAIPAGMIEPFLSQPLIIEENELKDALRIVATQEGRVFLGKGDKAYVRGDLKSGTSFQGFRPGTPLKDPVTKLVIGYEAKYLGSVKLHRAGKDTDEAHTFVVVNSKEEMGVGDFLVPVPPTPIINYMPHAPEKMIEARIVAIYGGVSHAGQNQVVSINRGSKDGIDVGTVLELYRLGRVIADGTAEKTGWMKNDKLQIKLPDEQYGSLFVFRIFNNISYGLIMQVNDTVKTGDIAKSPE